MSSPPSGRTAHDYDAWAPSYDTDQNATRDLDAIVLRQAALAIEGRDVLELGAGTGKNPCGWPRQQKA